VGILRSLRLASAAGELADTAHATIGGGDVAKVANLPPEVAQAFGINLSVEVVDRRTAMTVPAVRRGRQVICATIGSLSLLSIRDRAGTVDHVDRQILQQPNPNTTLQHQLTWTADDLLFRGLSWWRVLDRDSTGFPVAAERLAPERVTVVLDSASGNGGVYVDGRPASDADIIRFDGPDEGVLINGGRALRTAILLEEAVRRFATLDVPLGLLKLAEGAEELSSAPGSCGIEGDTRSEIDAMLDAWEDSRRQRTTAYINRAIDYERTALNATDIELGAARQQQASEIARLLNLPPRYVNAPQASGMTYATTEGDRRDLSLTLSPYLTAIEQRLSMPDVTPRGQFVKFDLSDFLRGDKLQELQAAQIAVAITAMTRDEVRTDVLRRPPYGPGEAPPASPPAAAPSPGGPPA
jgi:phage portal protein BeeE